MPGETKVMNQCPQEELEGFRKLKFITEIYFHNFINGSCLTTTDITTVMDIDSNSWL